MKTSKYVKKEKRIKEKYSSAESSPHTKSPSVASSDRLKSLSGPLDRQGVQKMLSPPEGLVHHRSVKGSLPLGTDNKSPRRSANDKSLSSPVDRNIEKQSSLNASGVFSPPNSTIQKPTSSNTKIVKLRPENFSNLLIAHRNRLLSSEDGTGDNLSEETHKIKRVEQVVRQVTTDTKIRAKPRKLFIGDAEEEFLSVADPGVCEIFTVERELALDMLSRMSQSSSLLQSTHCDFPSLEQLDSTLESIQLKNTVSYDNLFAQSHVPRADTILRIPSVLAEEESPPIASAPLNEGRKLRRSGTTAPDDDLGVSRKHRSQLSATPAGVVQGEEFAKVQPRSSGTLAGAKVQKRLLGTSAASEKGVVISKLKLRSATMPVETTDEEIIAKPKLRSSITPEMIREGKAISKLKRESKRTPVVNVMRLSTMTLMGIIDDDDDAATKTKQRPLVTNEKNEMAVAITDLNPQVSLKPVELSLEDIKDQFKRGPLGTQVGNAEGDAFAKSKRRSTVAPSVIFDVDAVKKFESEDKLSEDKVIDVVDSEKATTSESSPEEKTEARLVASEPSPVPDRGPRIKHVCRSSAVALGKEPALFPQLQSQPRLSALPSTDRDIIHEVKASGTSIVSF